MFDKISRYFQIEKRGSNIKTEILGGITTFLTMSYIIFVNPSILSLTGMDQGALITVTCVVSALGTFMMAMFANVPLALAPGMGLNAFFTFSLVLGQGVSWQDGLGIVFLSGILFTILSFSGIRKRIAIAIPLSLIHSAAAGIGFFIAFIGLQNMQLIVDNPATLVSLGTFSKPVLLSIFGLVLMLILEIKKIPGGILIGIIMTTLLGFFLGEIQLPSSFISMPPSIKPIAFQFNILNALKWSFASTIFSFMFVDMFDSLALLLSSSKKIGLPKKSGEVENLGKMLYVDSASTIIGSALGTSTVTTFVESIAGITVGARTGFASIITALLFLISLFFTPFVASVPIFAVAPALVIVGFYMFRTITELDLSDLKIAAPSFVMLLLMPLTYSISVGLSLGFLTYILVHLFDKTISEISPAMWFIGALSLAYFIL